MDALRLFSYFSIGILVYFVIGTTIFLVQAQDAGNQTTSANVSLPTGGEGIPVVTANGTQVAEAAPADAIIGLFNYILLVAVPAIVALGGMILGFIRVSGLGKKYEKQIGYVENTFKTIDTYAPKIKQQVSDSGLAKIGYEIVMAKLDEIKPGARAEAEAEIQKRVPELQAKLSETTQQMQELKKRMPEEWYADNDDDIPRLKDGTVKTET